MLKLIIYCCAQVTNHIVFLNYKHLIPFTIHFVPTFIFPNRFDISSIYPLLQYGLNAVL
jgi:hypothetical protein